MRLVEVSGPRGVQAGRTSASASLLQPQLSPYTSGGTIERTRSHKIVVGRTKSSNGGESVSQSPLKDKASSIFRGQNPPFELRPKNGVFIYQPGSNPDLQPSQIAARNGRRPEPHQAMVKGPRDLAGRFCPRNAPVARSMSWHGNRRRRPSRKPAQDRKWRRGAGIFSCSSTIASYGHHEFSSNPGRCGTCIMRKIRSPAQYNASSIRAASPKTTTAV